MKVLLLGGGAREHAMGWKLAHSERFESLVSAPGNPGLAELGAVVPRFDAADPAAVADLAERTRADIVVVGPEAPLAAGVADLLSAREIPVFGPTRAAAQLETSKHFANDVIDRAGVPSGAWASFTDEATASSYLDAIGGPYVVKADGLAAGKGVLVTPELDAAKAWVRRCLEGGFGDAGRTVVIEEHLEGDEVSVFAVAAGGRTLALEPARDYKRIFDGDRGPNTGGMGSYSPVHDFPDGFVGESMGAVVEPVLETLASDGIAYTGFIYAGLMITDRGPAVLEFNCRLGDPEAEVILPRLESDFLDLLAAGSRGALAGRNLAWSPSAAVDVVLAAPGYPEAPVHGSPITGLDAVRARDDVLVFHAGTARDAENVVTAGGRVLNVVGLGDTIEEARATAYDAALIVDFPGKQLRTDIATSAARHSGRAAASHPAGGGR